MRFQLPVDTNHVHLIQTPKEEMYNLLELLLKQRFFIKRRHKLYIFAYNSWVDSRITFAKFDEDRGIID